MAKIIQVRDEYSGSIEFEEQAHGGYAIQYTKHTDEGKIHKFGRIENGRYGDRHWIKDWVYGSIAAKLIKKFEELSHINPKRIFFIEDTVFEDKGTTSDKWVARMKKASKDLEEIYGYYYVMETREYYVERLTDNQLHALIYHELRHIDAYGNLQKKHEIEDWSNMVEVLGKDWVSKNRQIENILDEDFDWIPGRRKQLTLSDYPDMKKAE